MINEPMKFHDPRRRKLPPSHQPCYSTDRNLFLKLNSQNRAKHVTSTVFTCFHYIHIEKNSPSTGGHVFSPIWTMISRVFTRENCHYIHIEKNAPPTGGHVFSLISTIFELV
ncbi:hypothetical protein DPMN_078657 [Dreissena polymorpha]|uniref:Uncharacterized protein n=1 Tax=Dreissena polymorpha TaxID=45954 RepID=A0A9D3YSX5_DREPO|nr:hypothetical protein DPMN_078657 [Dreissena polymorpha]